MSAATFTAMASPAAYPNSLPDWPLLPLLRDVLAYGASGPAKRRDLIAIYPESSKRLFQATGVRLQRFLGDNAFIFLDRRGKPRGVPVTYHSYFSWPTRGCAVNFHSTLAAFLDGTRRVHQTPHSTWTRYVHLATAVVLWQTATYVVCLCIRVLATLTLLIQ